MSKTFRSEEEGYEFYNEYAKVKGFSVRKEEVKYLPGTRIRFRRLYTCFREGTRSRKNFERPDPKRNPKALTRCGCMACFQIELSASTGEWVVKKFEYKHNHELAKEGQSAYLFSHRKMTDGQKADAVGYGIGGLRTHKIMDVMEHQAGGPDKLGFAPRDLYNFVAEYKKKKIEGRDAEYMLNYMASQKDKDADFFYRHTRDKDGHLRNIFWADAQSRLDYKAFGGVLIFDSTYRVNRYNLPFVPFVGVNHHRSTTVFACAVVSDETTSSYIWLLQTFLLAMRQKHPRSLITDGDHAMARAIYVVMPNSFHRLCSWHIEQNMIRHLRKEKLKDFRQFIYMRMEVDEFERRWAEYMQKYGFSEKDTWLCRMYDLREKWSAAYTKGGYFLRMRSNQRSESLNSGLHNHLDRNMSMVDLLEHSQYYVSRKRRNEGELDAKASQSVPFTALEDHPLLKSAARIYTPAMFKMVKEHFVKSEGWQAGEMTREDASSFRFPVSSDWGNHDVTCVFRENSLQSVNCHCLKMEREEIPC
jgi:zinc finger SWIM domain-containing protein 3